MKKRYIELHLHLDGAITPDIAKDLAALQKIKLPYKDERELEKALMVSKDCRSLNEFLECFKLPCSLLQTKEGIARAVYLVQENIKRQGAVSYTHLLNAATGSFFAAFLAGINPPINVKITLKTISIIPL